ncbi:MAG: putative metal-binding motif-containing protein [Sandaracinaceae bacterium]|nr:putative metal-binding motif-containing protein [Sandaracinaceae bacterium]
MRSLVLAWLVVSVGCGGGTMPSDGGGGADGGSDSGGGGDCAGATNGRPCGDGRICVSEACAASTCGDGVVDSRTESCDDSNATAFDGCENDCSFTCTDDTRCDDNNACNGDETCNIATHACQASEPLTDGAACAIAGGGDGVCRGGTECVAPGCGNSVVDGTEQCDDGMDGDDADGCTDTCEFTCESDADCSDDDVCTGIEACDTETHQCSVPTPLTCTPPDACHSVTCDPMLGCVVILIDADADMHASAALGACGDDCNDANPNIYGGAEELCDGLDNNCIGGVDEVAPTWYVDCDRDGYSASLVGGIPSCTTPASNPGCPAGSAPPWTSRRPVAAGSTDCDDGAAGVNPGATEGAGDGVDSNCDGAEICFLDNDDDGFRRPDGATLASTDGDCMDAREASVSDLATDCNDSVAAIRPNATEMPGDGVDQNCDGAELCFADADGDLYRAMTATVTSTDSDCADAGEASASVMVDCCDMDARQNPGSGFRADSDGSICGGGFDWNCDGQTTPRYREIGLCNDMLYPGCGNFVAGWATSGNPPPCGRSEMWIRGCEPYMGLPACDAVFDTVTQACQ